MAALGMRREAKRRDQTISVAHGSSGFGAPRATSAAMPLSTEQRIGERVGQLLAFERHARERADVAGVFAFGIDAVLDQPGDDVRVRRQRRLAAHAVEREIGLEDQIVAPERRDARASREIEERTIGLREIDPARAASSSFVITFPVSCTR